MTMTPETEDTIDAEQATEAAKADADATGAEATDADTDSLFEANMAAFAEFQLPIHRALEQHHPVSKLEVKDNGEYTIQYKDFDFYPDGADTFTKTQTDVYKAHARRLTLTIANNAVDTTSLRLKKAVDKRFDESGFRYAQVPIRDNAYFAIALGLGLGKHLDMIAEMTRCRVLVIVEPNLDFIYHSLSVYDWKSLFEEFAEQGREVFFFADSDPTALLSSIKSIFRAKNPVSLDGTVVFQHYQSSIFQTINKELDDELRTAIMGLGYFEDEINMIAQTYKNLESGETRIMRKLQENPGLPAFIVATGPSLDALMPFLKENADKAAIFSCGTSIDVLMSNGVEPDFWIVSERTKDIFEGIEITAEKFDISNLRFAGSTTVFPPILKLFRESILFFRPGLSPAPLFPTSEDEIADIPDPLVANCALSFALSAGFKELYFLGVDCGSHAKDTAHAKGSWYERGIREDFQDLGLAVKGNFGGTVWSTALLQWSRENLEKLMTMSRGRVFYNLGNGALIKGATPKHPRTVALPAPAKSKAEIIDDLAARYPVYTRTTFEHMWEKAAIIDRLPEYCEDLKNIVRNAENLEDFGYITQTMDILRPAAVHHPLALLLRGTVFTSMLVFEYLMNRAVDEDERMAMSEIFKEEYAVLLDHMRDTAVEIFTGLEDGEPWEDDWWETADIE